jgi:hypothetical protein
MSHVEASSFQSVFSIPNPILEKLETSYNSVKRNFRENRFEPSELNGAKFCEAVFRVLEWHTTKKYTPFGSTIKDLTQAVKKFENMSKFPDSVRFHIPKILDALYGIRNKRGVGHLGGDVDPNQMDAIFVVSACDWIMAELVRIFHQLSTEEAQRLVQDLVTKKIPIIWKIGQTKRVLAVHLSYKDKALALLYGEYPRSVKQTDLFAWVEHSNVAVFRRDILRSCHEEKLIEFDEATGEISLSPLGLNYVEQNIKLAL